MTWQKKVSQWRKLKPAERKARRWADVPRQVAARMAFEGEPVDIEWLKTLLNRVLVIAATKKTILDQ